MRLGWDGRHGSAVVANFRTGHRGDPPLEAPSMRQPNLPGKAVPAPGARRETTEVPNGLRFNPQEPRQHRLTHLPAPFALASPRWDTAAADCKPSDTWPIAPGPKRVPAQAAHGLACAPAARRQWQRAFTRRPSTLFELRDALRLRCVAIQHSAASVSH